MSEPLALEKPPNEVQIIGGMHLAGGIFNLIATVIWVFNSIGITISTFGLGIVTCCVPVILLPIAIFELYSGVRHFSADHKGLGPPRMVAIAELASIIGCNVFPVVFGILTLVLLQKPEVSAWYERNLRG